MSESRGIRHGFLVLAALGLSACSPTNTTSPSVVLVTVDTLRADHLGAYGAEDVATPHIDRLAAEGTLYERAVTPMPMTRPATFSIFTSRYPREHGVVNNALSLPKEAKTLAERFLENGYRTAGFVGVRLLSSDSGAAQGFQTFGSGDSSQTHRPASAVVTEALEWLANRPSNEAFFLWVHLFDPHLPYEIPDGATAEVDPTLALAHPSIDWKRLQAIAQENNGNIPSEVLDYAKALYRAEVAYTDTWVGKLLAGIDKVRDRDQTVVAFTTDHGECFERGIYFEHSDCLYQGAVRVPLILRHPGKFPAGTRDSRPVSSLDIGPTLLSAAGLPPLQGLTGKAIGDLPEDGQARAYLVQHPLYQPNTATGRVQRAKHIQSVAGDPVKKPLLATERVGVVGQDWKYIRTHDSAELFKEDANETPVPLLEMPVVSKDLAGRLDALVKSHPLEILDQSQINEELRQTLEALGYIEPPN